MSYSGRKVQRLRQLVWETYPPFCCYCSTALTWNTYTVEHLLPRSKGGSDAIENLRPSCGRCNYSRGNRTVVRKRNENATGFFKR
ncbi:HNH endonuclease [Glutamicibacter protophormiae]